MQHKPNSIFEAAAQTLFTEAKKIDPKTISFRDPIWDVSYDRKTIEKNVTFDDITAEVNRRVRGAKLVTDSFTVFDLKTGMHKELLFSAGLKGRIKIRVQLNPMKASDLKKDADSFGRIK